PAHSSTATSGAFPVPLRPSSASFESTAKPPSPPKPPPARRTTKQKHLLFPQSHRWVEIGSASCRQPARYCGDQEEDHRHGGESHAVRRFHTHQHCGHATGKGERRDHAGGDTDSGEAQSLSYD